DGRLAITPPADGGSASARHAMISDETLSRRQTVPASRRSCSGTYCRDERAGREKAACRSMRVVGARRALRIAPGPVGVITNRPTAVPVSRLFPDIEGLKQHDARVYFGGPVA